MFDFNNQLTSHQVVENSIPIANYSFSYDAGGNALTRELDGASKNFEYSTDNRISTVDSNSAQYDNDGNLVSITIDGVTKNFSYDSRNRLTGDSQVTYSYDSEDRRISKIVGTDTTSYAIDPSERLSKVLVKTINGVSTYYVYGLGLISEETNADYKLYHFDYRGSTILLTDGTGQITDSYSYGPFGNVSNHTGTSDIDYLFLGQFGVITDENELTYMNDRYYAPYIGRFLNEDPYSLRYNDITNLNLYGYCGNDPINNVDPSGNFLETLFDIVNLAFSAKDFFSDPTVAKFATLAWDTAAAALPFIPGSYVKKGLSLADDAFDLVKGGLETGIIAKNGIKIEGFTSHGVDRAIGDGMKRAGVKPESILDAIKNPLKINDVVTDQLGRQSQRFIGETAEIVINPLTGKIVSINPTSSSKAAKLLKELGVQK